ncbi:porin PorA family protein [Streptomyces maremycinicus]|uniref:porin PorA family protein n=1 Tax=Streptomyces maremycinicus TaxID=1679753 RepID=UPI00099D10B3|nr:porin PorA family protein [Streptomyces sp. NBRC 110468]
MRRRGWIPGATAVALVAASAVTRFTVYPALHQVPAGSETTFRLQGTATLLNSPALSGGSGELFLRDVPVKMSRHVEVTDADGRTAVVHDTASLRGPDGRQLAASAYVWALDRRDLTERPAPAGSGAQPHTGLTVGWPLEPHRRDYPFWDTGTRTSVTARYTGDKNVKDRKSYVYDVSATGKLADPAVAKSLPAALPRAVVTEVANALPAGRRPSKAALAALPETVPLTYGSTTTQRAWIDTATGLTLDGTLHQSVTARTTGPDGPLALFPVTEVNLRATTSTVQDQADTAADTARLLWLLRDAGPLGLLALALLLAVVAVRRARRTGTADRSEAAARHPREANV